MNKFRDRSAGNVVPFRAVSPCADRTVISFVNKLFQNLFLTRTHNTWQRTL